ncbi:MAG: DNA polymerase III subunit gamma/tau [Chlorobi bacterium]|nr:DNA polymerase III subunit gamma/tau [Chlorobiota bacterium]
MENFIVSARKYRPQTFDTVVGQSSITNTLKNAIRNEHLAQAFLFCGPRGVGKTTCARILAKTINCENVSENIEACNECESCVSFNQSASFNIHELDAASNNSVDDIRNLVDQVRIPPQVGRYKVYIIDEVHMLSQQAFNAFLKTLEEPPPYAKFILATTEKHKIIPTILSRCQIYDFKRITVEDIALHLANVARQESVDAEADALHIIAQKADGALRDALSIFDQIVSSGGKKITYKNVVENLNVLDYDYFFKITESIIAGDIVNTLLIINDIFDNGFDGQHFILGFGDHLRNLLVCKDKATISLLEVGEKIKNRYLEQSSASSLQFLIKALDINNKCDIHYKDSNNKKLHLELALMQMSSMEGVMEMKEPVAVIQPPKPKTKETSYQPTTTPQVNEPVPVINETAKPKTTTSETPPTPVAAAKPVSRSRTISIKKSQEVKKEDDSTEEDLGRRPADSFTAEDFTAVWGRYVEKHKNDALFYVALTKNKPVLKDNFIIEHKVDNKVQETDMANRKQDLLSFIRNELNNWQVQLNVVVSKTPSVDKPYTSRDKYESMLKKNPALGKLKSQLNLDIDF